MMTRRGILRFAGAGAVATCAPIALDPNGLRAAQAPGIDAEGLSIPRGMRDLPARADFMLGYPVNMTTPPPEFFAWRKRLFEVGVDRFAFNNVGNPSLHSHFPFNTHEIERELIARFARLHAFDPHDAWGFLTNSGTDSNMHGMYMGRTILKNRTGTTPKVYFTREAHYSIQILRDLLALDWVEVGTNPDGGMDVNALAQRLDEFPDHPALVVATIGTTFKGAIDSIDGIQARLKGRDAHLHLDAALFGGYLPHTKFAADLHHQAADPTGQQSPPPRYDSLAVSCHKFFGFPAPAGLFLATRSVFDEFRTSFERVHDPSYIHQVPGTITCSRDAVKPADFYFFSSESAFARQAEDAREILANTEYLMRELSMHFDALRPTRANDRSNTVYFRQPGDRVVDRYSLATMELTREGERARHAHVVVMPHARKPILDRFLDDLARDART